MPRPWPIDRTSDCPHVEPPLVMGRIRATDHVLEKNRFEYLDWLDSMVRQMRLDGAQVIELDFETRYRQRIEACEAIAPMIVRTTFGINTLPICVRTWSPTILNAAIRYAVPMACTSAECLAQCPDYSETSNKELNVIVPAQPPFAVVDYSKERIKEIYEAFVAEFRSRGPVTTGSV
ncbi:MAG: hypothetical protein R3C05_23400 [Pirellulaceae bacterium]